MAKPRCTKCNTDIDGETVWYRQFADLVQDDHQTWRFISTASYSQRSDKERPLHPECFEKLTGQKWPPSK